MKTCENCKHWIPMKELDGKCVLYGLKHCAWTPSEATCDEWANEESEADDQYADLKKTLWDIDMSQYKKGAESEDRHYIKIYADDEPSVKAEKLYQICDETQNKEVAEWLKEYFPSIEAVQGEWKPFDLTWGRNVYFCTACKESTEVPTVNGQPSYNYCPNCGARMKGADDE